MKDHAVCCYKLWSLCAISTECMIRGWCNLEGQRGSQWGRDVVGQLAGQDNDTLLLIFTPQVLCHWSCYSLSMVRKPPSLSPTPLLLFIEGVALRSMSLAPSLSHCAVQTPCSCAPESLSNRAFFSFRHSSSVRSFFNRGEERSFLFSLPLAGG